MNFLITKAKNVTENLLLKLAFFCLNQPVLIMLTTGAKLSKNRKILIIKFREFIYQITALHKTSKSYYFSLFMADSQMLALSLGRCQATHGNPSNHVTAN